MSEEILDDEQLEHANERRRALLPLWIKIFVWIFLLLGAIVPVAFIMGLLGMKFSLSLYGMETMQPLSYMGLTILALMALKGIVAFGLWMEKEWVVNLAIGDAVIGIVVCILVMILLPSNMLRLEIAILIPYLLKMRRYRVEWMTRKPG